MNLNIDFKKTTGEINNQFVGIKINNNKIEFHYPETYELSPKEDAKALRNDVLAILRTISIAKKETSNLSTYNSTYKSNNTFPLGSYLWIINDYLTYGRYENKEKKYVNGIQGRVDWKKTMRTNPVISNGNIIYTKIISEKRNQKENILTEIYRCCVKKSMDNIGWLYGLSFDCEGVDYNSLFEKNYKYYLSVLNTELTHTNDDMKKTRLQNMKNIFTGLDDESIKTREMVFGVDSYDYVYERMIDEMFSNIDDISEFYPNGTIDLILEPKILDSSNLRPDTIAIDKKNKKAYIIDAKNYRYGTTFLASDVPQTASIQKQVTYGEYIKKIKKEDDIEEIYSAFIMPYSKNNNAHKDRFNQNIEFVGISSTKWYSDDKYKNRKIANLLIDMKFLINNWNAKNQDNLSELISKIESNINGGVIRE